MEFMITFNQPAAEFARRNEPSYGAAWGAYVGAIAQAGIVKSGSGLLPPETGVIVRVREGQRAVQDGPYADVKEHLGGYYVIDVPSLEMALEWAARSPAAQVGSVEVRPVMPPFKPAA